MRFKRPVIASLDQVRITRGEDEALIEHNDPSIPSTHLKLGPRGKNMTDEEILTCSNETIAARDRFRAGYEHLAIEIPPGKGQIQYFARGDHWTPRGDVLRCIISDNGTDGLPVIQIDEHDLSWEEFGRLVSTCAGWGMRVVFVPDDEIDRTPNIEVREPGNGES